MAINNAVNAKVTGFQSLNATTGVWNGRTLQEGTGISITNPDGTAGDPTISATSSPPDSSFGTLVLVEDFLFQGSGLGTLSGDTNFTHGASGWLSIAGVANHPGILKVDNGASLLKNVTANPILPANGEITLEMVIRVSLLGAGDLFLGLADTTSVATTTEPVNGCYFLYDNATNSGQWVGKTSNASTRSSANSANTVTLNQWDKLKIIINAAGTSVAFYVNDVEITNSPLATNIPTAALGICLTCSDSSTTKVDVDLITLKYVLAVSR